MQLIFRVMNSIRLFGLLLYILQSVLCDYYKPWEDLKRHYKNYSYDHAAAEERQKGFENVSFNLYNALDRSCFNDCFLRSSYKLLSIEDSSFVVIPPSILQHFENDVLQLQKDSLEIANQDLNHKFTECIFEGWTDFDSESLAALKNGLSTNSAYDEIINQLCPKFLKNYERVHIMGMMDCVKRILSS